WWGGWNGNYTWWYPPTSTWYYNYPAANWYIDNSTDGTVTYRWPPQYWLYNPTVVQPNPWPSSYNLTGNPALSGGWNKANPAKTKTGSATPGSPDRDSSRPKNNL